MGIELNFDLVALWLAFQQFSSQNIFAISWQLFFYGGWVIFLAVFDYGLYLIWLDARQGQYMGKWKHQLLAIDIPKDNEQTPKAVENIFTALAGIYSAGNLIDRYWHGKMTESFSFEIVSLEGYIQFLIRTPAHFRDLVEAAVYSQYPEAEITEVEDYTQDYANLKFPNDKYNLWGAELVLVKDYPYSIKTYQDFEHQLSGSFIDPMANTLEVLSRFGPGEQLWLQLVVTPQPPGWGEKAKKVVKGLMGQPYAAPENFSDKMTKPVNWLGDQAIFLANQVFGGEVAAPTKKEEDQWKMFKLSPGERLVFENIQRKLSKIAFRTKFRVVYLAEKSVFSKPKGVAAVIGSIQQFNVADSNGFKPGPRSKTAADYFNVDKRVAKRQNRILKLFAKRNNFYGDTVDNMFLSNEELATLWHFPALTVKAPTIEKIGSKKGVPPSRLPYESLIRPSQPVGAVPAPTAPEASPEISAPAASATPLSDEKPRSKPTPPANLPTV